MGIDAKLVKTLREKTGAGMMDCKNALVDSEGELEKAVDYLRKSGVAKAEKKGTRDTREGLVYSYIHAGGRLGVLLELNCETDFVARTPEFLSLAHDLALQIASMDPKSVDDEKIGVDLNDSDGETRLMHQDFIKDPNQTISDLITEAVSRIGENIVVRRFTRYELGKS